MNFKNTEAVCSCQRDCFRPFTIDRSVSDPLMFLQTETRDTRTFHFCILDGSELQTYDANLIKWRINCFPHCLLQLFFKMQIFFPYFYRKISLKRNMYSRLGKTGSLGPWSRVMACCSNHFSAPRPQRSRFVNPNVQSIYFLNSVLHNLFWSWCKLK